MAVTCESRCRRSRSHRRFVHLRSVPGHVHAVHRPSSPADERLAAVLAGRTGALDGDVLVQARPADQAAATVSVAQPVLAGDSPDVLVDVTGLVQTAPAGQVVIRRQFRPCLFRRHGQHVGPEGSAERFKRLRASIFRAYRKWIAPLGGSAAVLRVRRLPAAALPASLYSPGQHSPHRLAAEASRSGEGSRLHGSRDDSAHLRFCLSRRFAEYQSSEQAARNFASLRS